MRPRSGWILLGYLRVINYSNFEGKRRRRKSICLSLSTLSLPRSQTFSPGFGCGENFKQFAFVFGDPKSNPSFSSTRGFLLLLFFFFWIKFFENLFNRIILIANDDTTMMGNFARWLLRREKEKKGRKGRGKKESRGRTRGRRGKLQLRRCRGNALEHTLLFDINHNGALAERGVRIFSNS